MTAGPVLSFDLDDTLWPVGPVIAAAEAHLWDWLERFHPQAAHGHSIESMRALRAGIAVEFPQQGHDLTFLRREALARQFRAAGCPERLADEALEVFLRERNRVEFYPDVQPALARLRERHRLFALSNGNADLDRCGIGHCFSGHVTARSAGAAKPDARIFAELTRIARVPAADILHVGDDPLADVVGATKAGMQAVWINREGREWPPQYGARPPTVRTLTELLAPEFLAANRGDC